MKTFKSYWYCSAAADPGLQRGFLKTSRTAIIFCSKTKTDPKDCFFSRDTGLFKRRGPAGNALISNVTQRKRRHAKFMSQFFFSQVNEYTVTERYIY